MEKKQIAVIANQKEYANFLKDNLAIYFEPYAKLTAYSVKEMEDMTAIGESYVVVSAFTIFQKVRRKVKDTSQLIIVSINTLRREGVEKLKQLPSRTRALLVNIDYRTCMQVITLVYDAGFRDMELIPYWGGDFDSTVKVAITPDEIQLVPPEMEQVVNIYERFIDMNCIMDIADRLGISDAFNLERIMGSKDQMFFNSPSIERLLGEKESLSERISALIRLMDQGVLVTDVTGKIYASNEKARRLLKKRSDILNGFSLAELLPEVEMGAVKESGRREELVRVLESNLVVNVNPIKSGNQIRGHIILFDRFEDIEQKQHDIRSKLDGENHTARYRFSDIIGESQVIHRAVESAQRLARSHSSVVITGASGTGKEVFAQSIHNGSDRGNYHFVAVNCGAIPENLLESELFGYEEGAFTGAKKGGKLGFFELAHKGTIFLDEIADLPLMLQSKLLRVLEEKKILRVGSRKLIRVDVRIIAATNRDLYQMVLSGAFREDLYYRLNVLPIHIPDLKDRGADILLLFRHFMELNGSRFVLLPETEQALFAHPWRGNIRELRNVVEYLTALDKSPIDPCDLPFFRSEVSDFNQNFCDFRPGTSDFRQSSSGSRCECSEFRKEFCDEPVLRNGEQVSKRPDAVENSFPIQIRRFLLKEGKKLELYRFLLIELHRSRENRRRMGRNRLRDIAEDVGLFFTEPEIRLGLSRLDHYGFVRSARGRGGTVITEEGEQLLKEIKRLNW